MSAKCLTLLLLVLIDTGLRLSAVGYAHDQNPCPFMTFLWGDQWNTTLPMNTPVTSGWDEK
jgi:hypothetical protein